MTKVAFIGASSVVTDLCGFTALQHGPLDLMLHDIDEARLGYAEALVRRINTQTGAAARIGSSLDRQAAVEGADYVINEIQVGGYRATRTDFELAFDLARFGVPCC